MSQEPMSQELSIQDAFTQDAVGLAQAIREQRVTAQQATEWSLNRIREKDPALNCFTAVLADEAQTQAAAIDAQIQAGHTPGPLAGVPFAVKNLFDISGITTLAGAKITQDNPPAQQDATLVHRLKQAGAILVGALNMDEYAYGFTTENAHYGPTRNPHDLNRVSGGSSGGSASAVAAGLVPLTLGSDTNGSIRVPAALCGLFGLKPTYGRLSRAGAYLFASSFDHVGPFARSVRDIALTYDLLQGADPADPICTQRDPEFCLPHLGQGIEGIRIAVADGHFAQGAFPEALAAVQQVAQSLGVTRTVTLPEAHRARAAAFVITASEGSNRHAARLRSRPQDFDPGTRDRFLAGSLIPAQWYLQAQRFRRWYQEQVRAVFQEVDVILAPTTPYPAPLIGQNTLVIDGVETLVRPNLGVFTQPISFIGLPVLSVPVTGSGRLPLGVQLIAAPYQERRILQVAAVLEKAGVVAAPLASLD